MYDAGGVASSWTRWGRWLLAGALAAGAAACGGASDETTESSRAALVTGSDDVLGFEKPASWSISGANASSTPIRTQGAAALLLEAPKQLVTLKSAPIASTATALAGLADPTSQLAIDVMLPKGPPNTNNPGALKVVVSSRSRGLDRVSLGHIPFFGLKPEIWHTIKFAVSDDVRTKLGASYDDLRIELQLNTPGTGGQAPLVYRLDHLRVHAPSQAPQGVHQSADLVALRTYDPASSTPGTASFDVGIVQIPASFHVKTGSARTGSALLELGFGGTPSFSCTYGASQDGTSYAFSSCTNGANAGDLLGADFARLTIVGGDPAMGPTKVRAQLALNPVGDVAGSGVIPPMPTFWGDTPASANQIVTSYFDAVHAVQATEPTRIATPVPEFARRFGDGAPHDNLTGLPPPAPLDPPFDHEGHLNAGGNWDAYWRLAGNLTPSRETDNRFKNHFEATLSANAVVWGHDVSVVAVKALADSDSGQVNAAGLNQATASGGVHLYLFGLEVVKREATPTEQFSFDEKFDRTFDLAKVQIWIFEVAFKVRVGASFTASGVVTPVDVSFQVTPEGAIGAIVSGGVNLGVASGTVSADVDLLRLKTPVRARATWYLSTDPAICSARLFVDLTSNATLSSLGGKIDLNAKVGVCPFCYEDSYNIFSWEPLASKSYSLIDYKMDGQLFPLPSAACVTPLTVTIAKPVDAEQVSAGVPYALQGKAVRPATVGVDEQTIDCARLRWTSSDASDIGFPATGCTPVVTFGNTGSRTLTLTASSPSGETGSATRTFDVVGAPTGPSPFITSPADGSVFGVFSCRGGDVSLVGGSVGGTGTASLKWSVVPLDGGGPLTITNDTSTNATLVLPGGYGGQQPLDYRITLTATDQDNRSNSTSIRVTTSCQL